LKAQQLDRQFLAQFKAGRERLVTILPGSRRSEVTRNFALQVRAAEKIHRELSDVRFAVASYNEQQAAMAAKILGKTNLPISIIPGKTPELIHAATCCLAVSGSVSLELLYHAKPSVVQYNLSPPTFYTLKSLVRVQYMTLANLLTTPVLHPKHKVPFDRHDAQHQHVLFPEYPDWRDRSDDVASHAIEWLRDEPARQLLVGKLERLRDSLATGGASARAAEYILKNVTVGGWSRERAA
jgi:lipid-A-disaccharide synthase